MPSFLQRIFARVIGAAIARAVLDWFGPYAHAMLVANDQEFATLAAKFTDPAILNAYAEKAVATLPEAETFHLFHRTLRIPLRSVLTPGLVGLVLVAIAKPEAAALDRAHTALTDAYAAAIKKS